FEEEDRLAAKISALRPYTKVALNPRTPTARSLLGLLTNAQETETKDESISIGYGLPKHYDLSWRRKVTSVEDHEGQHLILVAFDPKEIVGYAGFEVSLIYQPEENAISAFYHLKLVYVH